MLETNQVTPEGADLLPGEEGMEEVAAGAEIDLDQDAVDHQQAVKYALGRGKKAE